MKTAFINGIILDGTLDMVPQHGKAIIIEGEKITNIVEDTADLSGCDIIDLNGHYIMPGLINLHVHTPGTGKPSKKPMNLEKVIGIILSCEPLREVGRKIIEKNMESTVMSGTTTIRTVGGIADFDSCVRDRIAAGKRKGPRILSSDTAISVEGGHMAGTFAYIAHSADEAASLVDKIAKGNPDLIKLMITGGIMDSEEVGKPGKLLMPPEYVKAAVKRAHELGYQVAAHCEGEEGVKVALENGVDTIEHGSKPTDEIIELYKKNNAAHVITISPALPYVKELPGLFNLSEVAVINSRALLSGMVEMAKKNLENGVLVGLGTDSACSYSTQYNMWRELVYFVKYCDVTPNFALHTATQVNAEIAGIGDLTGTIAIGKAADMMVTEKNPLENLEALENALIVVANGRIYKDPKPKKYPEVEEVLKKLM